MIIDDDQPDLVDEHFRPFVRVLGNLVITFALCEARLLELVSVMLGDDELKAVTVLKAQDAKDQVLSLVRSLGLSGYDLEELVGGVEMFWTDKAARNRLIHDEWYPSLRDIENVGIRGLTRAKVPQVVFGTANIADLWMLALRFRGYSHLFSHRAWFIRRERRRAAARRAGLTPLAGPAPQVVDYCRHSDIHCYVKVSTLPGGRHENRRTRCRPAHRALENGRRTRAAF